MSKYRERARMALDSFLSRNERAQKVCTIEQEHHAAEVCHSWRRTLYFVQCNGDGGPVKIGITGDIERRMVGMQTSCPYPLKLLACVPFQNVRGVEMYLHERFKHLRIHGEWFSCSDEILSLAADLHCAERRAIRACFLGGQLVGPRRDIR